jgi:hypothetical protein
MGDVPSHHLMHPIPSAGRRCQGHPGGGAPAGSTGKQCTHAGRRTILIFYSVRSFPCTPRIHRPRATGHRKIARQQTLEDPSSIFFMSLGPHVGAQSFCACPSSAIKGEAYDVTKEALRPSFRHTLISSYKLQTIHHTVEHGITLRWPEPL